MAYYPKNFYIKPEVPNLDNQKASINSDEAKLRTFPANSLGVASFFGAQQIHQMGENIKALVFGATGETLEADLTVSQGHRHLTQASRLRWLQLATFPLVNSSLSGDDIEDSLCVRVTASTKQAVMRLFLPFEDAKHVVPRFRLSVAPAPSATVNINLVMEHYKLDGSLVLTTSPLSINTSRVIDREWFEGPPVDLSTLLDEDGDFTGFYPMIAQLKSTMGANTEFLYIHEVSWGVYDL